MESNPNSTSINDANITETVAIFSESEVSNIDLDQLDNDAALLLWNSCLCPERLTTFYFCFQNVNDILDSLYLTYKEFKINRFQLVIFLPICH